MLRIHLCFFAVLPFVVIAQDSTKKVVCYYDSQAYYREESANFLISDLENSLASCTQIIYGYAIIGDDYKIQPLDTNLDIGSVNNYKAVTGLKKRFPWLHILLSVGGKADKVGDKEKYLTILRDANLYGSFVASARQIIEEYGFDGIDLAWQFPDVRIKQRGTLSSIWHKIKKTLGYSKGSQDLQANEHKIGFTSLIKQLNVALKPDGHLVTASVLPHTNYSIYFDPKEISPFLDAVHLFAFDFITPEKKIAPEIADYPAPLYTTYDRNPEFSVDHMVTWFLNNSMPANKIVLGVPAYGRSWKLTGDSNASGVPPLEANGEGPEGHLTHKTGILSYPEICALLKTQSNYEARGMLIKVTDPTRRLGTYAYRYDDKERGGIWVGYEDTESMFTKATFARTKGLGGVAVVDITMDDFKGVCNGDKFPLLKAVKHAL